MSDALDSILKLLKGYQIRYTEKRFKNSLVKEQLSK